MKMTRRRSQDNRPLPRVTYANDNELTTMYPFFSTARAEVNLNAATTTAADTAIAASVDDAGVQQQQNHATYATKAIQAGRLQERSAVLWYASVLYPSLVTIIFLQLRSQTRASSACATTEMADRSVCRTIRTIRIRTCSVRRQLLLLCLS